MMEEVESVNHFIACSDIISLVLLLFALVLADLDPRRRVWGRGFLQGALITFAVAINVVFSGFRIVFECIHIDTGPREFLLASVVYCSRWIWLYYGISSRRSRSGKAFQVARHLKNLKTIRLGNSKKKAKLGVRTQSRSLSEGLRDLALRVMNCETPSEQTSESTTEQGSRNDGGREGQMELVIRSGSRISPRNGEPYWRGVEKSVETFESDGRRLHVVHLVERKMHSDHLAQIGTYEYKRRLDVDGIEGLYKKIYDLVMTCDLQKPNLKVDYESFLKEYSAVSADTSLAKRTGSVSQTPLGGVARRIAADGCYYVKYHDGLLKTEDHVKRLNECIDKAAETCLKPYKRLHNPVADSVGENAAPNNGDSNV